MNDLHPSTSASIRDIFNSVTERLFLRPVPRTPQLALPTKFSVGGTRERHGRDRIAQRDSSEIGVGSPQIFSRAIASGTNSFPRKKKRKRKTPRTTGKRIHTQDSQERGREHECIKAHRVMEYFETENPSLISPQENEWHRARATLHHQVTNPEYPTDAENLSLPKGKPKPPSPLWRSSCLGNCGGREKR